MSKEHFVAVDGLDPKMLKHAGLPSHLATLPGAKAGTRRRNDNSGWAAFDRASNAGRLMAQLYGERYQPSVEYPTPRGPSHGRRDPQPPPRFSSTGLAGADASDARSRRRSRDKAQQVKAPKVGMKKSNYEFHAIDFVQRRRSSGAIEREMGDLQMRIDAYRPPHVMPVATEAQKARLAEINELRGGKVLPQELTAQAVEGPLPSEAARVRKERDRIENLRRRDRGERSLDEERRHEEAERQRRAIEEAKSYDDLLREQLRTEIAERQLHFEELTRLGTNHQATKRVENEIKERLGELYRLEHKIQSNRQIA